jgi:hypothetical protein
MRFQPIHLALVGSAHGTARAVDDILGLQVFLTAQLGEFAEAGLEDALHRTGTVPVGDSALVEIVQIAPRPEIAFEALGLGPRLAHGEPLHEDVVPGHDRDADEQRHDGLDDGARLEDQVKDGKVLGDVHLRASSCWYR